MGKKACEEKISVECGHLMDILLEYNGEAVDLTEPLHYAVSNIICSLVYGSRFKYENPQFTNMVEKTKERIHLAGSPSVAVCDMFPWTKHWIKDREELLNIIDELKSENLKMIHHLKETLDPQMCRGFIDAFLAKQMALEKSGDKDSLYTEENLMSTVLALFIAGTDTTSTTLRWGLLLMAKYPHIQDKVREEINSVIGSRQVQTEDRKSLPFVDAVIHEIQRFGNIAPMAISHRTTQDIVFQGHFIKKGTIVWPLLTSILKDAAEWENPNSFYPEHFLDDNGKFRKRDAFLAFSAGRRTCPGESLARMELFIFFVSLLQRFRFTAPPGVRADDLDLTPVAGITLSPRPHQLCALPLSSAAFSINQSNE
ncbi:hypothetical protein WMY93_025086 [Mugilogobius chulae]|uniref:Cytochrome P450 2K1-like n=1 Tax=Mugilogobius chulae TaxID=88201 RepID=A0AAW0N1J7_9GOBI